MLTGIRFVEPIEALIELDLEAATACDPITNDGLEATWRQNRPCSFSRWNLEFFLQPFGEHRMLILVRRAIVCAGFMSMLLVGGTSLNAAWSNETASQQEERGIAIGSKAPDFSLKNQNDEDVSLSELLENHNVAVVFYRSASW